MHKKPRNPNKTSLGFTLIELAVTLVIVGILASSALPLAELALHRQKESDLRAALRDIRSAIDAYHDAARAGQIARSADASGYPKNLDELVKGVEDIKSPKHAKVYWLRRLPRDPFYSGDASTAADTWGKRSYASPPDQPMEGEDVFDVYSTSTQAGLNGVPYRDW